jgi:hypothetical protein
MLNNMFLNELNMVFLEMELNIVIYRGLIDEPG